MRRWLASGADARGAATHPVSDHATEGANPDPGPPRRISIRSTCRATPTSPTRKRSCPRRSRFRIGWRSAPAPTTTRRVAWPTKVERSFPSWNWAPLLAPAVSAVYRRLWLPGMAFAVWPLVALAVFRSSNPALARRRRSLAIALLLLWVTPGVVGAMMANTLVYSSGATTGARRRIPDERARPGRAIALPAPVIAPMAAAATGAGRSCSRSTS